MIGFIDDATTTVPRKVQGQDSEAQHHPAEDPVDPLGVVEMGMRIDRIDERRDADTDRGRARHQHGPGEYSPPMSVQQATFSADQRDP